MRAGGLLPAVREYFKCYMLWSNFTGDAVAIRKARRLANGCRKDSNWLIERTAC